MTTALTTARPRRLHAAAVISGQQRLNGKALAKAIKGRQPKPIGPWQAMDRMAEIVFSRLNALEGEVATLRGQPASDTPQDRMLHGRPAMPGDARVMHESGMHPTPAFPQGKRKTLRLQLNGDITRARVTSLIDALKAAPPDQPIKLTINSRGGNVDAAHDLADVLTRHKAETHCHAVLDCSSAAVIVMLSARKRTALAGTHFTLHRPSLARRLSELSDERIEGMIDNAAYATARLLASRTGVDADVWQPMLATARGRRLDSATACELGIIHGLTRPHEPRAKR